MKEEQPPLNLWKNIERCYAVRLDVVYEGETIVGIHHSDFTDVIHDIDRLCKKLQEYKHELMLHYTDSEPKRKSRFYTYVYVLKNNKTGLYKIGRSIKPKFREKTLASEQPDVSLVFVSPLCETSIEKELHRHFQDKRVRGEWFSLSHDDVQYLINHRYGA